MRSLKIPGAVARKADQNLILFFLRVEKSLLNLHVFLIFKKLHIRKTMNKSREFKLKSYLIFLYVLDYKNYLQRFATLSIVN